MMKFERLEGPDGIPVFYQKLPEFVKSTGIALVVFTGGADDTSVGEPGLYHWFEHLPFRGTKKFPGGYQAVKGPVERVGGRINANTTSFRTNYFATLPTRHLGVGLDVIVDMVAQPLLTNEAIDAEREIIKKEILSSESNPGRHVRRRLFQILWKGHPLEHPVLGTLESLDSMTPETIHEARRRGYDRSRMAFFISTALSATEVIEMVSDRFELLPTNDLPERRTSVSYSPLIWTPGERTVINTDFPTSAVFMLFHEPTAQNKTERAMQSIVHHNAFGYGGLVSPLYRAVREDEQLAYHAGPIRFRTPDGGYWGFAVDTSSKDIKKVEEALRNVLKDPQARSKEWFDHIHESRRCALEMEVIDPEDLVNGAIGEIVTDNEIISDDEWLDIRESIPHEEILEQIEQIHFGEAHVVIALGK